MDALNKYDWAKVSGLLPIHLGRDNQNRFIMLDGGCYDFCVDFTEQKREAHSYISEAWSSNSKNYVFIHDGKVYVYNWLKSRTSCETVSKQIVEEKIDQFIAILNKNSYKTSEDVTPFVIGLFRQMRNLTHEKHEPIEALNLLYRLLVSLEEKEFTQETLEKWHIKDVNVPNGFAKLIEAINSGFDGIKPNLDLILRHSSGQLFQEAHHEALSFNSQLDLFRGISTEITLDLPTQYSSIHYTPQYLARSIVEQSLNRLDLQSRTIRILDPACGSGSFLTEVLKQLKDRAYHGRVVVEGWDISQCAVSTTDFLTSYERRVQWHDDNITVEIKLVRDSLREVWTNRYDLILMNPPFLSMEQIKDKEAKEAINETLAPLKMRKRPNQASAFLYKAVTSLNDNGVLGVVLPSSLLLSEQYIPLRDYISEMAELHVVGHLGNFVFEDALADVSIVIISKGNRKQLIPQTIWCKNNASAPYEAIRDWRKMYFCNKSTSIQTDFNIYTPNRFPIVRKSWKTLPFGEDSFMRKLDDYTSMKKLVALDTVFHIHQGLIKGNKNVFEIDRATYENLDKKEKLLYRPLASSETILQGRITLQKFIWYPYSKNGLVVNSEEEMRTYEDSYRILSQYKELLLRRKGVKNWWELTRPRSWQYITQKSIISKRFGNTSSFAINEGNYVVEEGNALIFKRSNVVDDDFYFYLAIFSSSMFEHLLGIYAKPILMGFDLGSNNIKDIPVPLVNEQFRQDDIYRQLVELGKMYSIEGRGYVNGKINILVNRLYPYES